MYPSRNSVNICRMARRIRTQKEPHAGIFYPPGAPPPMFLSSSIIHDVLRQAVKTAHIQFFSPWIPACISSPLPACKTNKETGFSPLWPWQPKGMAGVCCCCFLFACRTPLFLCEGGSLKQPFCHFRPGSLCSATWSPSVFNCSCLELYICSEITGHRESHCLLLPPATDTLQACCDVSVIHTQV